ncbi:MAG: uracil-DNA glycosylase family protein [Candidatus Verstraetearchaeota archaeon]|nr:uracil-DNA glycosylase family protein [Candidatus Verstraetearchaeota archaeon]
MRYIRLEPAISSCTKCTCIDKPYVKHQAYSIWLPRKVEVLAIGESPPPGHKESFFYNLGCFDRLRQALKYAFKIDSDEQLLQELRDLGVFITAAVKCRPLSKKHIPAMRANCVKILQQEVEVLKPSRIVAMGSTALTSTAELYGLKMPDTVVGIYKLADSPLEIYVLPHPLYLFRFRRELLHQLKLLLSKEEVRV